MAIPYAFSLKVSAWKFQLESFRPSATTGYDVHKEPCCWYQSTQHYSAFVLLVCSTPSTRPLSFSNDPSSESKPHIVHPTLLPLTALEPARTLWLIVGQRVLVFWNLPDGWWPHRGEFWQTSFTRRWRVFDLSSSAVCILTAFRIVVRSFSTQHVSACFSRNSNAFCAPRSKCSILWISLDLDSEAPVCYELYCLNVWTFRTVTTFLPLFFALVQQALAVFNPDFCLATSV